MKKMPEPESPFTDVSALLRFLDLSIDGETILSGGKPMLVPRSFARRMRPGDRFDPLLLQVLPTRAEATVTPGFTDDPVGDGAACRQKGILQKYRGRALLTVTESCALHCRFCFRRNRPSETYLEAAGELDAAVRCPVLHTDVSEVVLSGGDPLMLPLDRFDRLLHALGDLPHLARVRVHTRVPIADPARVDDDLLRVLAASRKPVVAVLHTNHPQELNDETAAALEAMAGRVHGLLNQTVLLRRVNDDVDTLVDLSERLVAQRVLPYYLHQLDRASGTAHFETTIEKGRRIIEGLRARCAGYLVPRYVREESGEPYKTPL